LTLAYFERMHEPARHERKGHFAQLRRSMLVSVSHVRSLLAATTMAALATAAFANGWYLAATLSVVLTVLALTFDLQLRSTPAAYLLRRLLYLSSGAICGASVGLCAALGVWLSGYRDTELSTMCMAGGLAGAFIGIMLPRLIGMFLFVVLLAICLAAGIYAFM